MYMKILKGKLNVTRILLFTLTVVVFIAMIISKNAQRNPFALPEHIIWSIFYITPLFWLLLGAFIGSLIPLLKSRPIAVLLLVICGMITVSYTFIAVSIHSANASGMPLEAFIWLTEQPYLFLFPGLCAGCALPALLK